MTLNNGKISNALYDIEKFDGKINFQLQQVQMLYGLILQGLHKALKGKNGKPTAMSDDDWEEYDLQESSTICLCFAKILYLMWQRRSLQQAYGLNQRAFT